jgi:hypothetical protein
MRFKKVCLKMKDLLYEECQSVILEKIYLDHFDELSYDKTKKIKVEFCTPVN